MALQVRIAARAAAQVRQAAAWWTTHRPAAPGAVAADFGEAVALLAEQPGIGSPYKGSRTPGVRRLYLGRIRYFIYYRADGGSLDVLAFWHASRGQQPAI
ncbi:MAG: type II toxin-antitoxin system RelE/ParE family toxin [Aquincola sp.]|uniref:type II toxin-antitoxin system RelE/ParE family toxin n=1 Tax=uncultured Aquincola sp. TaxID=886556 RepID=UPI0032B1A9C6|nr:type II toxin-antitoxin system RelE/ParE family toxin [Aquincola sp.]|tara:strand:- start:472 stop:771 length:300 start_codon:yes stop_codon:yes gene_type:complete